MRGLFPFRRSYQITFAGGIFSGITTFVFLAAGNSQANLLFFAFGLMVGALLVSGLFSTMMLRGIDVEREVADHAEVGQRVEVRYQLSNGNRRWPCFAVHVTEYAPKGVFAAAPHGYCLHLSARQSTTVRAHLVPAQRGRLRLQRAVVSCAFPFGLVRRVVQLERAADITVYPRVGALNRDLILRCRQAAGEGPIASQTRGGNDEFYGLRDYRAGDNVKAIHWRRTARTGQLMVREMTHAAPPQMIVAIDLRGWKEIEGGMEVANRALELAAALVCHGIVENYAIGLRIAGGQDISEPHMGRESRDRLLTAIAMVDLETLGDATSPPIGGQSAAEWVVVTLRGENTAEDVVPPGATCTRLPMDHAAAGTWVVFPESRG